MGDTLSDYLDGSCGDDVGDLMVVMLILSGCVRIACSGLIITSLLQVVIRLAASCELHAGLMQVVSSSSSKSDVHRLDAT